MPTSVSQIFESRTMRRSFRLASPVRQAGPAFDLFLVVT